MRLSPQSCSWTAFCVSLTFTNFFTIASTQNSTSNSAAAAPYSAFFDQEVYSDGTGVDEKQGLNNPTVVAINVPEGDNRDDLFIHFSASADKHAWAGFGFGESMSGSLMFLAYRSGGNASDVTVSPRLGTGHTMPQFTDTVNYTLLDLSGIDEHNRFVVNMQCFNCRKWKGGEIAITGTSLKDSPVFYALGPDGNLESNDQSARIGQHERFSEVIGLNLVPGPAGIPIVVGDPSEPRQIPGRNGTDIANGDASSRTWPKWSLALHLFFMCFAFSIVFPGGFLLLRLFERVWLHWIPQSFGLLCVLGGLGAGIRASIKGNMGFTHPHQIFGFIIVFLLLVTWTLGFIGHRIYKKTETPSPLMRAHRIAGPLSIVLGIANGLAGFAWLGRTGAIISYAVMNVFVALIITGLLFWKRKRDVRKGAVNSHAASNFREGNEAGFGHGPAVYYGGGVPPSQGFAAHPGVPMQTFYPNK